MKDESYYILRQAPFFIISDSMNVVQCKMARAALDMSAARLAELAGVTERTVRRFEAGETIRAKTVLAMARVLVGMGAAFIETEAGRGVLVRS